MVFLFFAYEHISNPPLEFSTYYFSCVTFCIIGLSQL